MPSHTSHTCGPVPGSGGTASPIARKSAWYNEVMKISYSQRASQQRIVREPANAPFTKTEVLVCVLVVWSNRSVSFMILVPYGVGEIVTRGWELVQVAGGCWWERRWELVGAGGSWVLIPSPGGGIDPEARSSLECGVCVVCQDKRGPGWGWGSGESAPTSSQQLPYWFPSAPIYAPTRVHFSPLGVYLSPRG